MINRNMLVKDIVLDHPETAAVFQRHRVDYCCGGDVTVGAACAARDAPERAAAVLWEALEEAVRSRAAPGVDVRALDTAALVAHIVETHHAYLRRTLPFLTALAAKVARVHGDHNPKLTALADRVTALRDTLEPHIDEEERVLFPAFLGADRSAAAARACAEMLEEHRAVGALLSEARALADDFTAPAWACTSYRTLLRELEALETDTLRHVHLENHVLAPRLEAAPTPTIAAYLVADHARLDALLTQSVDDPAHFDAAAFEELRAGLIRHMAIEERIVYPDACFRRGGKPLDLARRVRIHHAALALLATQEPSAHLVGELRQLLLLHIGEEEGPGGTFEQHARLLTLADEADLVARAAAFPAVRRASGLHPPTDIASAAEALRRAVHAVDEP